MSIYFVLLINFRLVFQFLIGLTFIKNKNIYDHIAHGNVLNNFFQDILLLKQNIGLTYLKIQTESELFEQHRETNDQILKSLIQITQKTSIKCVSILPVNLNQEQLKHVKFWFVEPFGEYHYKQYPNYSIVDVSPFSHIYHTMQNRKPKNLTVSCWGNQE